MGARLALLVVLTLLAPAAWAKVSFNFGGAGGGSIRPGDDSTTCSSTIAGAIRYNSGALGYCNGTVWTPLAAGGASGTTVAAGVSGSIQFNSGGVLAGNSALSTPEGGNVLYVGANSNTSDTYIRAGVSSTGNHYAYLDLIGDATYTAYGLRLIRDNQGANSVSKLMSRGTGGLYLQTVDAAPIVFTPSSTEAMRILPSGSVGIGTSNPQASLDVGNRINNNRMQFTDDGALEITRVAGGPYIDFKDTLTKDNDWRIQANNSPGLQFYSSSTIAMTITPGGNIGIGTAPYFKLHVAGEANPATPFGDYQNNGQFVISGFSNNNKRLALGVDTSSTNMVGVIQSIEAGIALRPLALNPSGGNVGIGTTSPNKLLTVNSATDGDGIYVNSANNTMTRFGLQNSFRHWTISNYGGNQGGSAGNFAIADETASVPRFMIVSSTGNVGIGTSSPNSRLTVNGQSGVNAIIGNSFGASTGVYGTNDSTSGNALYGSNFGSNSAGVLGAGNGYGVYCSVGNCGGGNNWTNTSDIRLKERIKTLPDSRGIALIDKLRPVTYHWRDKKRDAKEGQQIGFIAQDVEKLYPEMVLTDPSTTIKSLAYSEITVPLVKATQELSSQVRTLRAENDLMRRQLDAVCKKTRACS